MIRAVLFDLDGTLYDRDALVRSIVNDQLVAFRDSLSGVDASRYRARVIELDAHGYSIKKEVFATIATEFGLGAEMGERLLAHFWETYDGYCTLSDDVARTLQTLKREGKKLGVITNGSVKKQEPKLKALGLDGFFDTVLISQREGVHKPDPLIFQRALDRCGVKAGESMFVGDHPEVDVAGASRAGLLPVWKRVPYWEMSTDRAMTIDDLSEILPGCLGVR